MRALLSHRVAAAVEHLEPIRFTHAATLLDVGANRGQFSLAFRNVFPDAQIVAFEPLSEPAGIYESLFRADPRASLHRVAIADQKGTVTFFVADRDDSSSLLPPGEGQAEAFGVRNERTIEVQTDTLDARVSIQSLSHPIMMKIDVQGAELRVLQGCAELEMIDYIYVELSFVELYDGQPLLDEVTAYLRSRDFVIAGVYNQVFTQRFGPTQADFLFTRRRGGA